MSHLSDTHKTESLRDAVRSSPSLCRLHLARVDLADDAPSGRIRKCECKDEHNDKPSAYTDVGVHAVGGIQASDDKHAECQTDAAENDRCPATPAIGVKEGGNGDGKHQNCGDTRCEEGCCASLEAGLGEEGWSIL